MEEKIEDILKRIESADISEIGLLTGLSGQILLFYEYSKVIRPRTIFAKKTNLLLDKLENKLVNNQFGLDFCSGLAGVGWLIAYLNRTDFIIADSNILFEEFDEVMNIGLNLYIKTQDYDFLHGINGLMFYYLCRMLNSIEASKKIDIILNFLGITAEKATDGIKWKSILDVKTRETGYNISLSHGISSIVVILCKLYSIKELNQKKITNLIIGATNYILSQEIDKNKYGSFFPNFAIESMDHIHGSRLAWCYGDLGIAMALWQTGCALQNVTWKDNALEVLLFAAEKRRNLQENYVMDAGLCHGTAGIGHIFYRMWWNTRMPEFKNVADYWFEQTLKMAKFEDGLAGYKAWQGAKGWVKEFGLLEGISGIGLALLTYYCEIEPTWDECLLLS